MSACFSPKSDRSPPTNSGSRNIDEIFSDLLALTQTLSEEQGRHLREHLSEEELTVPASGGSTLRHAVPEGSS